jgi:hypothetical protein
VPLELKVPLDIDILQEAASSLMPNLINCDDDFLEMQSTVGTASLLPLSFCIGSYMRIPPSISRILPV